MAYNNGKLRKLKCPDPNEYVRQRIEIDPINGCWLWKKKPNGSHGYVSCSIYIHGKKIKIKGHQLSWKLKNGEIPKGLDVCHKCDIRHCINPDHLFLGTRKENMQDAKRKGRTLIGEKANPAKLTEEKAKQLYSECWNLSPKELSKKYGLEISYIYRFRRKEVWTHLF